MLQVPSYLAALAGGAEQTIAEAAVRAKAHIRLPIMGVLIRNLFGSEIRVPPARAACPKSENGAMRGASGTQPIASHLQHRHYEIETGFGAARLLGNE
jgi:hypothetical protein